MFWPRKDATSTTKIAVHWTPEGKSKPRRPETTWHRKVKGELQQYSLSWCSFESLTKAGWTGEPLPLPFVLASAIGLTEWLCFFTRVTLDLSALGPVNVEPQPVNHNKKETKSPYHFSSSVLFQCCPHMKHMSCLWCEGRSCPSFPQVMSPCSSNFWSFCWMPPANHLPNCDWQPRHLPHS